MKFLLFMSFLSVAVFVNGYSQSTAWHLVNGKALAQKTFVVQGKNENEIFKEISRWLVKYYQDPEESIKARIEGEYLRGRGYNIGFLKSENMSAADLQYSYSFEIKENQVIFVIPDAVLIYSSIHDTYGVYRIEEYFQTDSKKKRAKRENSDAATLKASLTDFSNSLFQSFEQAILREANGVR